jgi:hypothetical protein
MLRQPPNSAIHDLGRKSFNNGLRDQGIDRIDVKWTNISAMVNKGDVRRRRWQYSQRLAARSLTAARSLASIAVSADAQSA